MLSIKQGIKVSSYPLSRKKMFQQILQNFKSQKKNTKYEFAEIKRKNKNYPRHNSRSIRLYI